MVQVRKRSPALGPYLVHRVRTRPVNHPIRDRPVPVIVKVRVLSDRYDGRSGRPLAAFDTLDSVSYSAAGFISRCNQKSDPSQRLPDRGDGERIGKARR